MNLHTIKCPNCGAALDNIKPDLDTFFCTYCGYHIMNGDHVKVRQEIDIEERVNKDETHRDINESTNNVNVSLNRGWTNSAKVASVYAKRDIKLKQMEISERQRREDAKHESPWWVITLFCFGMIFTLFGMVFLISRSGSSESKSTEGMIQVGTSASSLEGENYKVVEAELASRGFTNIETIDLDDTNVLHKKRLR